MDLWRDIGSYKRPDFLIAVDNADLVVLDAKYKLLDWCPLSAPDQYQMFAYSHLARWDDAPNRPPVMAAVVYPSGPTAPRKPKDSAPPREARVRQVHLRGPESSAPFPLVLVSVPFPHPDDLLTDEAWTEFIRNAATITG